MLSWCRGIVPINNILCTLTGEYYWWVHFGVHNRSHSNNLVCTFLVFAMSRNWMASLFMWTFGPNSLTEFCMNFRQRPNLKNVICQTWFCHIILGTTSCILTYVQGFIMYFGANRMVNMWMRQGEVLMKNWVRHVVRLPWSKRVLYPYQTNKIRLTIFF